jgi:exopolysaccharide biosynthesis protein
VNIIGKDPIPTFELPSNTAHPSRPVSTPEPYEGSKRYSESPHKRQVDLVETYKNETSEVYLRKVVIGNGKDRITYYVADVFVSTAMSLKTAFARGKYGMNIKDDIVDIAYDNDAVLALSGDYYTNNDIGVVIRNGVYYRSEHTENDICVLYLDGTMKTYSPDEFDIDEVLERNAWQAWTFGPSLLDGKGNVLKTFNCSSYIKQTHPRAAIGYVRPGHYVLLVVDGREEGYSKGVDIRELAQIMVDEGCIVAYNLDGGKTACMSYDGELVNKPAGGGREIGDIIYIAG